jgi:hypothetical protein
VFGGGHSHELRRRRVLQNDERKSTLGLGSAATIACIQIRWPAAAVETEIPRLSTANLE